MADFISTIRKIPGRFARKKYSTVGSPLIVKRAKVLNDKSPFHVKEAYKAIRTNVVFSIPHEGSKKIIVTSALAGEGKSTNCLNLAISFSQTGAKVLLIDCDLRKPNVANLMNIASSPGLSNVLANLNTIDSVIVHTEHSNLDVIPSGDLPPNPAELLGSTAMEDALEKLSEIYEYIFLDTSPINIVTDAAAMSKMVDGILLVVRQGRTDKETVAEAVKKLSFVDANILGFILNGRLTDVKSSYRYGKRGYYRYGKSPKYYGGGYYGGYGYGSIHSGYGNNYYGYGYGYGYDSYGYGVHNYDEQVEPYSSRGKNGDEGTREKTKK